MENDRREGGLHFAERPAAEPPGDLGMRRDAGRGSGRSGCNSGRTRAWRSFFRIVPGRVRLSAMLAEESRYGHGFLWVPVFMGAGVVAELSAARAIPWPAILVPLAACVALVFAARARGSRWTIVAVLAAAFFAGMAAAAIQIERLQTAILDGAVVTHIDGVVTHREIDARGDWRYTIRLQATDDPVIRRPPDTVRLLARSTHVPVGVGEEIAGLARLMPPSGPALPGEYDFAFNSFFQGRGATGFFYGAPYPLGPAVPAGSAWLRLQHRLSNVREGIDHRIRAVLPGGEGAVAAALIVSDRRAIPESVVLALRAAGLAHVLSISGLHMALVAGMVFLLLRTGLGLFPVVVEAFAVKKAAALVALGVSTVYLGLSGAEVATLRSWIMLAIMLVAVVLDRAALTLRNVALAALVIVAVNPAAVLGPSFQMSFAATVALVAGYAALTHRRKARHAGPSQRSGLAGYLVKFAAAVLFTSLLAGSASAVFAAYHFHRVATFGLLGNLLAEPIITFVVMPAGLFAVLAMPYGLEAWPLHLMGWGLDAVIAIARRIEALDGVVGTGRIPAYALIVFVAGFLILTLMRSRLRLCGIPLLAAGLLLPHLPPAARPGILISEDGRMVGLMTADGIATNRTRPASFIMKQWLAATNIEDVVKPRMLAQGARPGAGGKRQRGQRSPPLSPDEIAAMRSALERAPRHGFVCRKKGWCGADFDGMVRIVTVTDLAYLGEACDLADIVVTAAAIRTDHCRSGALLFTGRTLRRSGAVEIFMDALPSKATAEAPMHAGAERDDGASEAAAHTARRVELTVVSAVGGVVRPWTVQRYYDWRSRGFAFDKVGQRVRVSVIAAH